jgi:photosystem II stability/assembly factor-like uncharacterized protein
MAALAAAGNATAGSGSTGTSTSPAGIKTLVSVNAEALGANCAAGGVRIEAGPDSDGNGVLAAGEVGSTQYVCHGAAGASGSPGATGPAGAAGSNGLSTLVQMRNEPSGANCAAGGKAIDAGVDGNANWLLDAAEISSTGHVCNGTAGANGSDGANGVDGTSGTNGTDGADGTDGTNGTNGLNTLVNIVSEDAGVNCIHGGSKVETGLDGNRSGVLEVGEVSTTNYMCNGAPGATLAWVDVTGTAVQAQSNTGYVARNEAAEVVVTLPPDPAIGDVVRVSGAGLGGWKIAQNAGQAIYTANLGRMAGAIWTAHGPKQRWQALASSADGRKLVAVAFNGCIYTSTNGGLNWTARATDADRGWFSVASSADGSKLVAVEGGGQIHTSTDSGVNWTPREISRPWRSVASSADGGKLVAVEKDGQIFTSTNGGLNWTARATDANRDWAAVASSADGRKLVAVEENGRIYTSTDSGLNWTPRETSRVWRSVASSADGSKLVAAVYNGQIHTSIDSGVTWTAHEHESARNWFAVTSSAAGSRLVAAVSGGELYTSTDGGVTWTPRASDQQWVAVASSADGSRLAAASRFLQINTSAASTTPGTSGAISGAALDAIELQYMGNSMFTVLSHEGSLTIQ